MKKPYLKKIYRFDNLKEAYIIDIDLDYYQEIFNDWDASPVRKKDLDPELVHYLESSSGEISRKNKLTIHFSLPINQKDKSKEKKVLAGIRNYYNSTLYFTRKELNFSLRKIALFITLGFSFILFAYLAQNQLNLNLGFDVLIEGVFIGGWVLLWEAFSLFFFSMYELRKKKSMYTRFLDSDIIFEYRVTNTETDSI
jgi:hypothetical protein